MTCRFCCPALKCLVLHSLLLSTLASAGEAGSGVRAFGPEDASSIAPDALVIHLEGVIDFKSTAAVLEFLQNRAESTRTIVLRLDSPGGARGPTEKLRAGLADVAAAGLTIRTLVHQGDMCASACIMVYMSGTERYAGNASVWGFHGACRVGTNIPDPGATRQVLADLSAAGVASDFLERLQDEGCFSEPGTWWSSGYELAEVHDAGIVTHLLAPWQPEYPQIIPPAPGLAPR